MKWSKSSITRLKMLTPLRFSESLPQLRLEFNSMRGTCSARGKIIRATFTREGRVPTGMTSLNLLHQNWTGSKSKAIWVLNLLTNLIMLKDQIVCSRLVSDAKIKQAPRWGSSKLKRKGLLCSKTSQINQNRSNKSLLTITPGELQKRWSRKIHLVLWILGYFSTTDYLITSNVSK